MPNRYLHYHDLVPFLGFVAYMGFEQIFHFHTHPYTTGSVIGMLGLWTIRIPNGYDFCFKLPKWRFEWTSSAL